jgi:hypothetical protein
MVINKRSQLVHNAYFTQSLFEFFVAKYIATNDIIIKTKSMDCHQIGESLQQVTEQALATKIKGVARQCIKHNPLARTPKISDLNVGCEGIILLL